jgi:hypothetical protein
MTNRILLLLSVCALRAIAASSVVAKEPPRDRRAFAEAMNKVKEGMPAAEVLALVGRPDDILTGNESELTLGTQEIWCYGTRFHGDFAALGRIGISDYDVAWLTGQGLAPREGLFTEVELRQIFEAFCDLPAVDEREYNLRPVIQAVDLLQPLGKTKALAAIEEFLRVSHEDLDDRPREGLFLVLRTLFDVPTGKTLFPGDDDLSPPGFMPPMIIAIQSLEELTDRKLLPRYPIVIEGDIPFLMCRGVGIGGGIQSVREHVDYFRKFGTLRPNPLVPTPRPFVAMDAVARYPRWAFKGKSDEFLYYEKNELRALLGDQVLRLLETVHRLEHNENGRFLDYCEWYPDEYKKQLEVKNKELMAQALKLRVRWDSKASQYTRLDGTFVPPFDRTRHPALTWHPPRAAINSDLLIRRQNRWYLELFYLPDNNFSARRPNATRVFDVRRKNHPIAEIDGPPAGEMVRLPEGDEIQIELKIGEQTLRSPVLKP